MPDWTYHPFFKPLLFRLGGEDARALTLKLLELQSRTALGRRIFRFFGPGAPVDSHAMRAFGLTFPSPVGLGPGIETHGRALSVLQELAFGFLVVGPCGIEARARSPEVDPIRIPSRCAIVESGRGPAPSIETIARTLERTPDLRVPIGVALDDDDLVRAIEACPSAAYFTIPATDDRARLAAVRAATDRPILVRIGDGLDDDARDRLVDAAIAEGIDGAVALCGAPSPLLDRGSIDGPFLLARSIAAIRRIHDAHGDRFPVVGAGGIFTPDDAKAILAAGAVLVEVHAGFVYAGPGFPARILASLNRPSEPSVVARTAAAPAPRDLVFGSALLSFTALVLLASGLAALILASTVTFFPYDVHYLGMTMEDLCALRGCRVVHFMAHDRVSFGGSILSIAAIYLWLARRPLLKGEAWAWWALFLSGTIGFGSFLTYLGYGYLDRWHGYATLALLPFFVAGLVFSYRGLAGAPRGISTVRAAFRDAWRWSPAGLGRWLVSFAAFGMIAGGLTIMFVGMTRVFVPTDLEFMQVTRAELDALNPRLVPLIAHDRAGFGGGLCSGGIAVMLSLWCGIRPGDRALWWALAVSGTVGFASAIGVHPIVGYTSFAHLLPAYLGALAFALGVLVLRKPLVHDRGDRLSDV